MLARAIFNSASRSEGAALKHVIMRSEPMVLKNKCVAVKLRDMKTPKQNKSTAQHYGRFLRCQPEENRHVEGHCFVGCTHLACCLVCSAQHQSHHLVIQKNTLQQPELLHTSENLLAGNQETAASYDRILRITTCTVLGLC